MRNLALAAVLALAAAVPATGGAAPSTCGSSLTLQPARATWRAWNDQRFEQELKADGAGAGPSLWPRTGYDTPSQFTTTHGITKSIGLIKGSPTKAAPAPPGYYRITLTVWDQPNYGADCPKHVEGAYTIIVVDHVAFDQALNNLGLAEFSNEASVAQKSGWRHFGQTAEWLQAAYPQMLKLSVIDTANPALVNAEKILRHLLEQLPENAQDLQENAARQTALEHLIAQECPRVIKELKAAYYGSPRA
jgi:hypothetical protein